MTYSSAFLRGSISALALMLFVGCGDDPSSDNMDDNDNGGGGGGSGSGMMSVDLTADVNKAGPQSLSGFTWLFDPVTVNGITLQLGFGFTEDMVLAQNTCDGSQTVSTSAPVEYSYKATITEDAYQKEGDDDDFCEVSISKGSFDFKIEGGQLVATSEGETLRFSPEGSNAGLYGTWVVTEGDLTIRWAIGNGVIRAEADCTDFNGLKARTQASATFENYVEILMPAAELADDGFGNTCEVTIDRGKIQYYFEGDTLVLVDPASGQESRLTP